MMRDLPTTIYVPTGNSSQDDNGFDDDSVTSDSDDLSLTREYVRSHCRAAPETRRAPPRTVSLESRQRPTSSRRGIARTMSGSSRDSHHHHRYHPTSRRTPMRTVSASAADSCLRSPVHLMTTMMTNMTTTDHSSYYSRGLPRRVSPTSVPGQVILEDQPASSTVTANPLDLMYREGLKKLARSMKHSDMTRSVIKRQSSSKYSYRGGGGGAMGSSVTGGSSTGSSFLHRGQKDFFLSPRCQEVEECRRQLLDMIHHQV